MLQRLTPLESSAPALDTARTPGHVGPVRVADEEVDLTAHPDASAPLLPDDPEVIP